MPFYPKSFLQNQNWINFWKEANNSDHDFFEMETTVENIRLKSFVYIYPWFFGQKFWYLTNAVVIEVKNSNQQFIPLYDFYLYSNQTLDEKEFIENVQRANSAFWQKINNLAKEQKISFIKLDVDDNFTKLLNIKTNSELITELKKTLPNNPIVVSNKQINLLGTMLLKVPKIKLKNREMLEKKMFESSILVNILEEFKDFYKNTNENIRRYTKKSLSQNWIIDTNKTPENMEAYWQVYKSTFDRQNFSTHTKEYYFRLLEKDFSSLILLKDEFRQTQAAWIGINLENNLLYLAGGNTSQSFKKYGQYLVHLVALLLAVSKNCHYYDLGGYDPSLSFSKFKDGYRGEIVKSLGPIDIVIRPMNYNLTNWVIKIGKKTLSVVNFFRKR